MIRTSLTKALEQATEPLSGRTVADIANLPYKVAIDGLGRLLDAGVVVRIGRKYSSTWALADSPAARAFDAFGALERAWRARTPTPTGGEGEATPRHRS